MTIDILVGLAVIGVGLVAILWDRRKRRQWRRHVDQAEALTRHPASREWVKPELRTRNGNPRWCGRNCACGTAPLHEFLGRDA